MLGTLFYIMIFSDYGVVYKGKQEKYLITSEMG